MPYDINNYQPTYGGIINSSGNVVNSGDLIDETTGLLKPYQTKSLTFQSGATATGNGTAVDVNGYAALTVRINNTSAGSATVTFEASLDNTNWDAIVGQDYISGAIVTATTSNGLFRLDIAGIKYVRCRISAYTTGTVNVTGVASTQSHIYQPNTGQYANADANSSNAHLQAIGSFALGFNGTTWDRIRVANVWKYASNGTLAGTTGFTVWTPASGKKYRVMGVTLQSSVSQAYFLRDAGSTFQMIYPPVNEGVTISLGNGYLANAANTNLELYNSGSTQATVRISLFGTEE